MICFIGEEIRFDLIPTVTPNDVELNPGRIRRQLGQNDGSLDLDLDFEPEVIKQLFIHSMLFKYLYKYLCTSQVFASFD